MRICAVDLKNNEAIICLLEINQGLFNIPDCRARKLTVNDVTNAEQLRFFKSQFIKLMEDYSIDKIVIRERPMKGKFSGSCAGFKLEAILQLIDTIDSEILTSSDIKQSLKANPINVSLKELGLKQFQELAFETAFAYLNK